MTWSSRTALSNYKDIAEWLRETDDTAVDTVLVTGSSAKVAFPGDTGHAVLWRFVAADVAVHLD